MTYLVSDNPWYLAGGLAVIAAGFLIALRVTQDGRYLIRAGIALGLAAGLLVIEQVWVTDAERVEWTVKAIAAALGRSDAEGVLAHLDDRVTFGLRSDVRQEIDPTAIRDGLKDFTFDWVYLSRLATNAGRQTGRGSAEFRVSVSGIYRMQAGSRAFAGISDWSLGFRKVPSGEWKVNRITAVALPPYAILPLLRFRTRVDGGPSRPADRPAADPGRRGR